MSKDDRYATFVAEENGKIVGLIAMVVCLAIGHPSRYAKINGLGALPEHRGKGIGRTLIEKAEEFAKANGATYLGLASGLQRETAHAFYEHMGCQKTSYWFSNVLPKPRTI